MTTTNCRQWAQPLAQDYSIVFKCPEGHIRTDGPSLARLPSGTLMSTFVLVRRRLSSGRNPGGGAEQ